MLQSREDALQNGVLPAGGSDSEEPQRVARMATCAVQDCSAEGRSARSFRSILRETILMVAVLCDDHEARLGRGGVKFLHI